MTGAQWRSLWNQVNRSLLTRKSSAYLAAGHYDQLRALGPSPWDIAAGTQQVQEAGGLISDLAGKSDSLATISA